MNLNQAAALSQPHWRREEEAVLIQTKFYSQLERDRKMHLLSKFFPRVGKLKNQQNECKTHSSIVVKDKAMKSVKEGLQEHSVINRCSLDTL